MKESIRFRPLAFTLRTALFFFFLSLAGLTIAQTDTTRVQQVKPAQGDWGMVLNLTGLIDDIRLNNFQDSIGNNTILIKHYRKEDLVYRIGIGINMYSRKVSTEDSLKVNQQLLDKDSVFKQSAYSFSFGLEKHLGNSRRLDPYLGLQAMVGLIGKTKIEVDSKYIGNTGTSTIDRDYVVDGGSMFGLHLIGGFNYFVAERFSIGAEYMLGYTYRKTGGNYSDTVIDTPVNGSSSSTLDKGELAVRDSELSPSGAANITLSYFFGKKR